MCRQLSPGGERQPSLAVPRLDQAETLDPGSESGRQVETELQSDTESWEAVRLDCRHRLPNSRPHPSPSYTPIRISLDSLVIRLIDHISVCYSIDGLCG